jgi:ketosteroid isomerase-like protein
MGKDRAPVDVDAEIAVAEQAWMDAWQRRDMRGCAHMLAEEFHLVSARSGELFGRDKWLALAEVAFVCRSFHFDEVQVQSYGPIAIAHCLYRQTGSAWGKDWSGLFRITDVWIWRDDRWQAVTRHSTQIETAKDDPQRDEILKDEG